MRLPVGLSTGPIYNVATVGNNNKGRGSKKKYIFYPQKEDKVGGPGKCINHTLSNWLGIQLRQCYTNKKEDKF